MKKNAPGRVGYPEETPGSRLAAKARKLANKLTPEQRREHFNGAMTMIYGAEKRSAALVFGRALTLSVLVVA